MGFSGLPKILRLVFITIFAAIILVFLASELLPKKTYTQNFDYNIAEIPKDLDQFLELSENEVSGLLEDTKKQIVWVNEKKKTPISILYVHGFSSSKQETRPLADLVASHFNANLFYTRLAGHGQSSGKMLEVSLSDWIYDLSEALEIGKRIGNKTVIIATSTGATLVTLALANAPAELKNSISGVIFISPNFGIAHYSAPFLTLPMSHQWGPLLFGNEQSFKPISDLHEKYWSLTQPTNNIIEMAHLVKTISFLDLDVIQTPAFFIYSQDDKVVNPKKTKLVSSEWGTDVNELLVTPTTDDDPFKHVIAGDIRSPSLTKFIATKVIEWIVNLDLN